MDDLAYPKVIRFEPASDRARLRCRDRKANKRENLRRRGKLLLRARACGYQQIARQLIWVNEAGAVQCLDVQATGAYGGTAPKHGN